MGKRSSFYSAQLLNYLQLTLEQKTREGQLVDSLTSLPFWKTACGFYCSQRGACKLSVRFVLSGSFVYCWFTSGHWHKCQPIAWFSPLDGGLRCVVLSPSNTKWVVNSSCFIIFQLMTDIWRLEYKVSEESVQPFKNIICCSWAIWENYWWEKQVSKRCVEAWKAKSFATKCLAFLWCTSSALCFSSFE